MQSKMIPEKLQLRVRVTQEDIDKGCKYASDNCPVSRATNRALEGHFGEGAWSACVSPLRMIANRALARDDDKSMLLASTPESASEFVWRFDSGFRVKPFEFKVTLNRTTRKEWLNGTV
jgi:hypothetical protein